MNPYKILNIDQNATKRDIMAAAARAMKDRNFSGKDVAIAQKKLMNPVSKAIHDFLYVIEIDTSPVPPPESAESGQTLDFEYLGFPDSDQ